MPACAFGGCWREFLVLPYFVFSCSKLFNISKRFHVQIRAFPDKCSLLEPLGTLRSPCGGQNPNENEPKGALGSPRGALGKPSNLENQNENWPKGTLMSPGDPGDPSGRKILNVEEAKREFPRGPWGALGSPWSKNGQYGKWN